MQQLNIFDLLYETYVENKTIWLIELFSGYGSQKLALDYLGIKNESGLAVDFDKTAIQTYNEIHNTNYPPMDITKLERLPIRNDDKYSTWVTYSFPCQDISNAGKGAGIKKGTRSGLLYEVQRLLERERENLPKVLILENVIQVLTIQNGEPYKDWIYFLSTLGYQSYTEVLNAKDYYVPQNRKRCFCVSILGDYYYEFPHKMKLKYRLKDFLESKVDESYYLSDKAIEFFTYNSEKQKENGNGFKFDPREREREQKSASASQREQVEEWMTTS